MPTLTPNHSFQKPNINGDKSAWGSMLNANFDTIDALLKVASDATGTFLPKTGGRMTGNLEVGVSQTRLEPGGNVFVGNDLFIDGDTVSIDQDANKFINFRTAAGATQAQVYYSQSAGRLVFQTNGTGSKTMQIMAIGESSIAYFYNNGSLQALIEDNGSTASSVLTLMTRAKGDGRYLQIANLASLGSAVATTNGKVAIASNDGGGNASLTFNHLNATTMQTGSAYRITGVTDSSTASMSFQMADSVASGVSPSMVIPLTLTTSKVTLNRPTDVIGTLDVTGNVLASNGTFSGNLQLLNTLTFNRTDGTVYFATEDNSNNTNQFLFQDRANNAIAAISKAGTTAAQPYTVMTREKADARYVNSTGGTMSGGLTATSLVSTGAIQNNNQLVFTRTAGSSYIDIKDTTGGTAPLYFRNSGNSVLASIGKAGTSADNTHTLMTREKGDARYANRGGDSFTGTVTVAGGTQLSSGGRVQAGEYLFSKKGRVYLDEDGADRGVWIRNGNGDEAARIRFEDSSKRFHLENLHSGKYIQLCNIGDSGTFYVYESSTLIARMDPPGVNTGLSLLTRDRGDARYTQISSDRSLKENILHMPPVLDGIVMQLQPRTFHWKDSEEDPKPDGMMFGMIADEVASVLPQAVLGEEGSQGLDALSLIGVLVKAVQELTLRVEELEAA